mgnify:CR=1 FL=1
MPDLQGFGPMLAKGTAMTVQVALLSTFFGVLIGIVVAMMKLSASRAARIAGDLYTTIVRGVPALVFILLIYFGGVRLVNEIARSLGHTQHIDLNAFVAGVFALSLAFGAYATEVFRGAFQAIPKGQIEAARSAWAGGSPSAASRCRRCGASRCPASATSSSSSSRKPLSCRSSGWRS